MVIQKKIILVFTLLILGFRSTAQVDKAVLAENNKDVLILATLIQDYLLKYQEREIDLSELVQMDSLQRISGSFESIHLVSEKSGLAVDFKFSNTRDESKVQLTEAEKRLLVKWDEAKFESKNDGVIRFAYGERSYYPKSIILRKN